MKTVIYSFLIFLLIPFAAIGQSTDSTKVYPKIEYQGYAGQLLIHRKAMSDMKANKPYLGHELRLGVQTTGSKHWHELFKYPTYGVGFYSGYFNNPIIGNPLAVFGFMEFPFVRSEKFYWSTSWGFGLSFNLNEYDSISNPENVAIGTENNVYVDFLTSWKYRLTPNVELGAGVKFQHFSNGSMKHPNLGLNMASAFVSASYLLSKEPVRFKKAAPFDFKNYEFTAMYAGGYSAIGQDKPNLYYSSVVSVAGHKRMNRKRTLGLGMDVFYNSFLSDTSEFGPRASVNQQLSYAGFLSTELIADKFRMAVQLGFYAWLPKMYELPFYERVAFRYYFIDNVFANISIKAHAFKAQYVEWGIGIKI